jgi:hypothetical protein
MIKIHHKFGNYFIAINNETIAMCTQSENANRIKAALESAEQPANGSVSANLGSTNTASREIAACSQCDDIAAKVGYALQNYKFCPYCGRQLQA